MIIFPWFYSFYVNFWDFFFSLYFIMLTPIYNKKGTPFIINFVWLTCCLRINFVEKKNSQNELKIGMKLKLKLQVCHFIWQRRFLKILFRIEWKILINCRRKEEEAGNSDAFLQLKASWSLKIEHEYLINL